ncbi:MAG TPA: hypothetical protein VK622_12955 [Puia sp.]|nr:hypothetical protein [Puia sp.]
MNKKLLTIKCLFLSICLLAFGFSRADDTDWPKVINTSNGTQIKVYEPEPESFKGNTLMFRSAISVLPNGSNDPVFGAFWATAKVETDRDNRTMLINTLDVTSIRIPAIDGQDTIDYIDDALETQFPQTAGPISLDAIVATLNQNQQEAKISQGISNKPPKVMFVTRPSMLVLIDGDPKLQNNKDLKLDMVANTPFTIVKNTDGRFYLYGQKRWYVSNAATGPYEYTNGQVPPPIQSVGSMIASKQQANSADNVRSTTDPSVVPTIIVSTVPAELIQSNGEPNFTPIQGTNLLYMSNSDNDIFMDENSQQYFVLISGRWFQTKNLNSDNWVYIAADQLPADFAKIPPGSPKDNVLASVAGTDAAKDAVMDAEIPQTAKVDRNTTTTTVTYDGRPKFTDIDGTNLQYAVNTSSTVLRNGGDGRFYVVDNGVWFVSDNATGPFVVSTVRPVDVDLIPPSVPVYNAKYVNIYDVDPNYVYMGYTPGYLNSFVYGPTVVYGTGFYYQPWYGAYYYPRPWSWGFNFGYTPYFGWGFGWGYSPSWFSIGFGFGYGYGFGGYGYGGYGWWGPSFYHPACWGGWHGGPRPYGFYGNNFYVHNNIHVNYANNVYRNRGGVSSQSYYRAGGIATRTANYNRPTLNSTRPGGNVNPGPNSARPGTSNNYNRPATNGSAAGRPGNVNNPSNGSQRPSLYSDRQGNVYQRSQQSSNWQQRQNRTWSPVNNSRPEVQNLNAQQMNRSRGEQRAQNFQRIQSSPSPGGFHPSGGGGGGSRPSGGGGGGASRGGGHR